MDNYYQDCMQETVSPPPEWSPEVFHFLPGKLAKNVEQPNGDYFKWATDKENDYEEPDTGTCVRLPYERLSAKEEKYFSARMRNLFGRSCLLIKQHMSENRQIAALWEEINSWSGDESGPVPQKRRVRRIRQAIGDGKSRPLVHARAWQRQVLSLLDEVEKAAHELIMGNMALVEIISAKFLGKGVSKSDLIQEGNIGLLKAAYRFDYSKATFATYATFWIRQAIRKAIMGQARTIRLPTHLYEQRNRFFKCYFQMRNKSGVLPTDEEVSRYSGIPMRMVKIFRATPPAISLDAPLSENEDSSLLNVLSDESQAVSHETTQRYEAREVIEQVLTELPPNEAKLLKMRYGFMDSRTHTLEELGKKFGLSRERIRQIEKQALKRLRHPVRREKLRCLL